MNCGARRLVLDNLQIAILTRVNDLAARFGIKPYEFVATVDNHSDMSFLILRFEVPVSGNPAKEVKFDKMLDLIGLGENTHELKGTDAQIIDALDNALRLAPKQRPRP